MIRHLIILLFICGVLPLQLGASPASSNDPSRLIFLQINNDMMYGADEYFGESRDLLYADQAKPEDSKAPATPVVNAQSSGNNSTSGRGRTTVSTPSTQTSTETPGKPRRPPSPDTPPVDPDPDPDPDLPPIPEPPPC